MKKTVLSALTAAFALGIIAPQASAAPIVEEQEPEIDFQKPAISVRPSRDAQVENELRDLRARIAVLERENDYRNSYDYDSKDDDDWTKKFNLNGEFRYRFWHNKKASSKTSNNRLELRLLPTIQINDNLAIKTRFTGRYNHMEDDSDSDWKMNFAYLEGKFDNFQVNAGKMPFYTDADKGMLADDFFSGVQVKANVEDFDFKVNGGVWDGAADGLRRDYIGAEALYDLNDELKVGAGIHHLQRNGFKANILTVGGDFQLNEDWSVNGAYGRNNKGGNHKDAFNIEADYLGAKRSEEGSWGAYVAYRYVPSTVGLAPTYDTFGTPNKKGFDFGGSYTPMKDTLLKVSYFHGKHFNHNNARTVFARASIFF